MPAQHYLNMLHVNGSGIIITSAGISARLAQDKFDIANVQAMYSAHRWGDYSILPLFHKSMP